MNGWIYLLQTSVWCAVGFVTGFLVGRAARDVHRIAVAVTEEDLMPANRQRRRMSFSPTRVAIALVVIALGVFTVVQGIAQSNATKRIAQCHAAYANAFADALEARSHGSQQAQDALDKLMTTMGQLSATPPADAADLARRREESRLAIAEYIKTRNELKDVQAAHPYPPPPRDACPNT